MCDEATIRPLQRPLSFSEIWQPERDTVSKPCVVCGTRTFFRSTSASSGMCMTADGGIVMIEFNVGAPVCSNACENLESIFMSGMEGDNDEGECGSGAQEAGQGAEAGSGG